VPEHTTTCLANHGAGISLHTNMRTPATRETLRLSKHGGGGLVNDDSQQQAYGRGRSGTRQTFFKQTVTRCSSNARTQ